MEEIIEETKSDPTLIEIVYNNSSDLKKLASRDEFVTFIITDSLKSIEKAIKEGKEKVELFNIYNLSLIIELNRSNFGSVLNNITKYYIEEENYEMCNRIKDLINEI